MTAYPERLIVLHESGREEYPLHDFRQAILADKEQFGSGVEREEAALELENDRGFSTERVIADRARRAQRPGWRQLTPGTPEYKELQSREE